MEETNPMPMPTVVASDEILPGKVDVAIIGGGIAGVATALELVEQNRSVALFEKGRIAAEQSSRNWGWCRQMGRDPRELSLIQVSLSLWRQMRQRLDEDVGFRECGIAYLCDSDTQMEKRQRWFNEYASLHNLSSHMISPQKAAELSPGATVSWKGGLYTPDDGRAEPQLAVPAMARAAQRRGLQIFQGCAVRTLIEEAGQVRGVTSERGSVRADAVLLAGGAWSRRFCVNAGIALPQLSVVNSVMRTKPLDAGLETSIAGGKFASRKRLDGGYTLAHNRYNTADILPDSFRLMKSFLPHVLNEWQDLKFRIGRRFLDEAALKRRWSADEISPFEVVRTLNPKPVASVQNEALHSLKSVFPVFQKAEIVESWAVIIDVLPDVIPILSGVASKPGFYIATGFSGHGFGLGPGAGKLMAEIITGERPCVDPSPFRYDRFG